MAGGLQGAAMFRKESAKMQPEQNCTDIMVSVVCCTYNHAQYIRQALDGFLRQQTAFRIEVLVHDDASDDGTADIIREYAEKHPDLILPVLETQNQWSKGVRFFASHYHDLRGKYIAFCEGDDYWTDPKKLQKQVDYMEQHQSCSLCVHETAEITEDGHPLKYTIGLPGIWLQK